MKRYSASKSVRKLSVAFLIAACLVLPGCGSNSGTGSRNSGSSNSAPSGPTQSVSVSISPGSAMAVTGATQQFTTTVTGTANTAVTWSVNGTAGGNTTVGTISPSGLYTTPATVPNPNTVTVMATSVADSTKSANATFSVETTITGRVVKGPVKGASVTVNLLNANGTPGTLLASTTTDANGDFSVAANLGATDVIVITASGGTYVGEATGLTVTLGSSDTLMAVVPPNTDVVAVTPLTNMAAMRAETLAASGADLSTAASSANTGVAQQYELPDILGILPVAPNQTSQVQTANTDQRIYGLVLAGLDEEAQGFGIRTIDLVSALSKDMSDGTLDGMQGSGNAISVPLTAGGTMSLSASTGTTNLQSAINTFSSKTTTLNLTSLKAPLINTTSVSVGVNGAGVFYTTSTVPPAWITGQSGSFTIGASGGTPSYTCALAAGSSLPKGFALSTTCVLSGQGVTLPSGSSMSISAPVTVVIKDSAAPPASANLTFRITTVQAPPTFTVGTGKCTINTACTVTVGSNATGGTSPYYFSSDTFANGLPPLGMVVGLDGALTGTPSVAGTYSFGVCVTDLVGNTSCKQASVTVSQGFTLTTATAGTGSGGISANPPGPIYVSGTIVTLTATAASGSIFTGWSGACSGTGTCTVTMNSNQSVTATFNQPTFDLAVTTAGSGSGTVSQSAKASGTSCGTNCTAYLAGTVVTLTATAASGSNFAGWSGACAGTGACTVTMTSDQSVTATFSAANGTPNIVITSETYSVNSSVPGFYQATITVDGTASGPVGATLEFGVDTGPDSPTTAGFQSCGSWALIQGACVRQSGQPASTTWSASDGQYAVSFERQIGVSLQLGGLTVNGTVTLPAP